MVEFYLIGYSGHAFVVIESALRAQMKPLGYFEQEAKSLDPYRLKFLGKEELIQHDGYFSKGTFFIGLGNNVIRERIYKMLDKNSFINVIDPLSSVSTTAVLKDGIYIGNQACINALATIGKGAIVNTGAIVEHECIVGDFAHIAPGAVLCGNVNIGKNTFVGANSVIRQGISVGENVTIGAGSVVTKHVSNNGIVYGNPAKIIK